METVMSRLAVAWLGVAFLSTATVCSQDAESPSPAVRIGVLYVDTPTGRRYLEGTREAVENHAYSKQVQLLPTPYSNDETGVEELVKLVEGKLVDIVLGPTESGVFVSALQKQEDLAASKIPVISGLVTASVANQSSGWFFRTNVDVTRRAQAIYDFVNKFLINSIAVVYADSEFGRRAAMAFEKELRPKQREQFLSLIYENPPNPRFQLRRILDKRPEAVGFFGEREDIAQVYEVLKRMNEEGTAYRPLFFTILDARQTAKWVDDIYFVSVTRSENDGNGGPVRALDEYDDVQALGHDTALLVLNTLQRLGKPLVDEPENREAFRNQFAGLMRRSGRQADTRSELQFTRYENSTQPRIFHLKDGFATEENIDRVFGWDEKLKRKFRNVFAVWGWWPLFCVLVILVIAIAVSLNDLYRLYAGSEIRIYLSRFFYLFVAGHFGVVLLLYIVLAENGNIRYDDVWMVLIISLAPSALLRTTFFETSGGTALGLERFYKAVIAAVDNRLMLSVHDALQPKVNLIAYYNSEDAMRQALFDVYRNHRSKAQAARLVQDLVDQLLNENDYFNRRRICARRLLRMLGWERIKAEGLVPPHYDELKVVDPQRMVRIAAKRCAGDPAKAEKIRREIEAQKTRLKTDNPDRYQELERFLAAEYRDAIAVEGKLNVDIRFLFVLKGFDLRWFIEEGILEEAVIEAERERVAEEDKKRKRSIFESAIPRRARKKS